MRRSSSRGHDPTDGSHAPSLSSRPCRAHRIVMEFPFGPSCQDRSSVESVCVSKRKKTRRDETDEGAGSEPT